MLPKKKMRQVYYDYDHGVHIVVLVPNVFNLRHTPPQADSESQAIDKRRCSRGRVIPHRQITARPFQARDRKISFKIQLHPFPSREENNSINETGTTNSATT